MGPFELEGSPIAFAGAGLVVAVAFAVGVAASTEPPAERDVGARAAYAECLLAGRGRSDCAPRRDAALTLCAARRSIAECEALLAETDRSPGRVVREAEDARLAGPLHGSARRAAIGAALAFGALALVVALRRPSLASVARLAAGAVAGLALASVPALAAAPDHEPWLGWMDTPGHNLTTSSIMAALRSSRVTPRQFMARPSARCCR